jgi:L-lysine exporter family protein LysE/ArgO
MYGAFFEGMMLGFGAAIPLGPINILIMTNALRSYPSAVALGAGAMSADTTYLVMIIFGAFHFLKDPNVMDIVSVIGVILLSYFAWAIWRGRNNPIHQTETEQISILKNYLKGYSFTLLNPYTLIFWFSVSAYIATKQGEAIYMLLGLFAAITLWITLMPLVIHKTKHLISQKMATIFAIVSAGILLFFAFGMAWSVISGVF